MKTGNQDAIVKQAISILSCELKSPTGRPDLYSPKLCADYLRLLIGDSKVESYLMLWLDARYRLIEATEIGDGSVDYCRLTTRALVTKAVELCARYLVMAHNHPSGDCTPSLNDREATDSVRAVLKPFEVDVLDHMVVGRAPGFPVYSIGENREIA